MRKKESPHKRDSFFQPSPQHKLLSSGKLAERRAKAARSCTCRKKKDLVSCTKYTMKLVKVLIVNSAPHLVMYMGLKQRGLHDRPMEDIFLTYICSKWVFKTNGNKQMQLKMGQRASIMLKTCSRESL